MKRNVELILKKGFVSRGFLGITFAPDAIADALNIPGVIVYGIIPNSPAEQAGVRITCLQHLTVMSSVCTHRSSPNAERMLCFRNLMYRRLAFFVRSRAI